MRDDRTFIEVLRKVPLLSQLSGQECEALAMGMRTCRYKAGDTIFHEGKPGDSLIIVADGLLSVLVKGSDGITKQVSRVKSGEVVGEMSCIDPAPRSATVQAVTEALCFELSRTMLQALQTNATPVAAAIVSSVIKHVTARLRATNGQILSVLKERGMPVDDSAAKRRGDKEVDALAKGNARVDLRKVPSLRSFSNDELKKLVQVAPPRTYPANTILCQENAVGTSCFIVAKGDVEILKMMEGQERTLATLSVGAMVGQMSLVDNAPRSATVKATQDVVALKLERSAFEELVVGQDPLGIRFQEQIAIAGIRQLRMANGRFSSLLRKTTLPPDEARPQPPTRPLPSRPVPRPERTQRDERPSRPDQLTDTLRSRAGRERRPTPLEEPQAGRSQLRKAGSPKPPPQQKPDRPTRPPPQQKRRGGGGEQDVDKLTFAYLQTALQEWDMSLNELDKISVVKADGIVSAEERKSRGR